MYSKVSFYCLSVASFFEVFFNEFNLSCVGIYSFCHFVVERRRRYNINDRIKELATLLPPTTHPYVVYYLCIKLHFGVYFPTHVNINIHYSRAMKLNKGSILKASVEYVKELKKDKEKLVLFETKQKTMEAKYQKMLIRIFVRISC